MSKVASPGTQIVLRAGTFMFNDVMVRLESGMKLTDDRMIAQARAAGVAMLPADQTETHAVCPDCGSIFEIRGKEREEVGLGLTRGELAQITLRSR